MRISKKKVVTLEYSLHDTEGQLLESSRGGDPLVYLHGVGGMISGLETALEGKSPGDNFEVTIPCDQAYGPRDETLIRQIPKADFLDLNEEITIGMDLVLENEEDDDQEYVRVIHVDDEMIEVDGNHPLAGETLCFHVSVVDVRDATPAELDHGHAHGPGGHHH